ELPCPDRRLGSSRSLGRAKRRVLRLPKVTYIVGKRTEREEPRCRIVEMPGHLSLGDGARELGLELWRGASDVAAAWHGSARGGRQDFDFEQSNLQVHP